MPFCQAAQYAPACLAPTTPFPPAKENTVPAALEVVRLFIFTDIKKKPLQISNKLLNLHMTQQKYIYKPKLLLLRPGLG